LADQSVVQASRARSIYAFKEGKVAHHLSISICFGINLGYDIPWTDIAKNGGYEDPIEIEALFYVCTGFRLNRRDHPKAMEDLEDKWPFEIITYGSAIDDTGYILAAIDSETRFSLQGTECFSIEDLIRSIPQYKRVAQWTIDFEEFGRELNVVQCKRRPTWLLAGRVI